MPTRRALTHNPSNSHSEATPEPNDPQNQQPAVSSRPRPPRPSALLSHLLPALLTGGCAPLLGATHNFVPLRLPAGTLRTPRALAFNPYEPSRLYIADAGTDSLLKADTASMRYWHMKDRAQYHYMDNPSSLAFDPHGQLATCQESLNNYEGTMLPNFFMGPTLYDTRLPLINSKQDHCGGADTCFLIHTDMLHESPLCMGIAHDDGAPITHNADDGERTRNVFWVVDGGHGQLVRYDFMQAHGPGSMDHSVAEVRRYQGLGLTRVANVPSGLSVAARTREVFVADTGGDRVIVVKADSGKFAKDARSEYRIYSSPADSFNYTVWDSLEWRMLGEVRRPCAIALTESIAYVASYVDSTIHAFDRDTGIALAVRQAFEGRGLSSLAVGPLPYGVPGLALYAVNEETGEVGHIEVSASCGAAAPPDDSTCRDGARNGDETDVDCGGQACQRCSLVLGRSATCARDTDCLSGECTAECSSGECEAPIGVCVEPTPVIHRNEFLFEYLDSDFYRTSFQHHMANGAMGGASYLNPYPIMEASFCDTIGRDNVTNQLRCNTIDKDSLLLGGCFCHPCLPENPCQGGGVCVNYQTRGYTCDCEGTGRTGDHCQHGNGASRADFPWHINGEERYMTAADAQRAEERARFAALRYSLYALAGVLLVLLIGLGAYCWRRRKRRRQQRGLRAQTVSATKKKHQIAAAFDSPATAASPPPSAPMSPHPDDVHATPAQAQTCGRPGSAPWVV